MAALCCIAPAGWAGSVSIGSEYFDWHEQWQDQYGAQKTLEESGLRYFLAYESGVSPRDTWRGLLYAKLYGAEVEYNGQTQGGVPAVSNTGYVGGVVELRGQWVVSGAGYVSPPHWLLETGVGVDAWSRTIHDSSTAGGYTENYTLGYGKFGIRREVSDGSGMTMAFGVKYPFYTREHVMLYDGATLEPKGTPSLYLSVGMQITRQVAVRVAYDGYRFDPSEPSGQITANGTPLYFDNATSTVSTSNCGTCIPYRVKQPQSRQDTLGLIFEVTF